MALASVIRHGSRLAILSTSKIQFDSVVYRLRTLTL